MSRAKGRSRGFTLIAALLVLALLSAIAVSLLFMVQGAGQVGGNDLETNRAYYGAESGMELLTANLAALYQQSQSPTPAQITNLTNSPPDSTMISGDELPGEHHLDAGRQRQSGRRNGVISSGSNAGLTAEIIPLTLKVAATRPGGASVNMTRGVEVALIPVFQFGVFSDSDLSYFAGPPFAFQGRVHTNGNLFLAANSGPLVIDAKVTAVGEIIRDRLANNYNSGWCLSGRCLRPGPDRWMRSAKCDGQCSLPEIHPRRWQLAGWNSTRRRRVTIWTADLDEYIDPDFQEFHRQQYFHGSATAQPAFRAGARRSGAADRNHTQASRG